MTKFSKQTLKFWNFPRIVITVQTLNLNNKKNNKKNNKSQPQVAEINFSFVNKKKE